MGIIAYYNTIAIQQKFNQAKAVPDIHFLGALPPSFGLPYFPFGVRKGSGKDMLSLRSFLFIFYWIAIIPFKLENNGGLNGSYAKKIIGGFKNRHRLALEKRRGVSQK